MNNQSPQKGKKKNILGDLLGQAVPTVIPWIVEKIIDIVPEGTKVDDFLRDYHKYWGRVVNTAAMLIKTVTNAPEIVDAAISELSAESTKAIIARYGPDGVIKKTNQSNLESYSLAELSAYLQLDGLLRFNAVLAKLLKAQQKKVLCYQVVAPKEVAKTFINNLAQMKTGQFLLWANLNCPLPEPREESELEAQIKSGWNDFTKEVEAASKHGGFFANLAKRKGLI